MNKFEPLHSPIGFVAAGLALWIIGTLISVVFPAFVAVALILVIVGKGIVILAGIFAVLYAIIILIKGLLG